jgi:hypothetical protein
MYYKIEIMNFVRETSNTDWFVAISFLMFWITFYAYPSAIYSYSKQILTFSMQDKYRRFFVTVVLFVSSVLIPGVLIYSSFPFSPIKSLILLSLAFYILLMLFLSIYKIRNMLKDFLNNIRRM